MRHTKGTHQHQLHHCSKCDISYKRKDYLIKHLKTCHPPSPTATTESVEGPVFFTSVGSQTKKCRLHKSKTLTHTLSGPDRPAFTDSGMNTDPVTQKVSYTDRACSPIIWGNISTPVSKPVETPVEEYFTASKTVVPTSSDPQDQSIPDLGDIEAYLPCTTDEPGLEGITLSLGSPQPNLFTDINSLNLDFSQLI